MDLNVIRQGVCVNELIYEGSMEQAVDSDLTLPDYCPDIQRILKCCITPQITGVQPSGGRITVDGSVVIRLVYVCEQGKLHCHEQTHPFSRFVEVTDLPQDVCARVHAKTEYVNCRAVSQRRVDIHASVTLLVRATAPSNGALIDQAEGGGVQLRRCSVPVSTIKCCVQRSFTVSEVLELGDTQPQIAQIISTTSCIRAREIKVIPNKILLKGELEIRTLYCSDESGGTAEKMTSSIPISQILEAEGIDEQCSSDVRLETTCLEVTPRSDAEGNMRLLDVTARICANICAYVDSEAPMVTDAYSTAYELNAEHRIVRLMRLTDIFTDTSLCKGRLELSAAGITSVVDLWCAGITAAAAPRDGQLAVTGTATVCILLVDSGGELQYVERQMDYEYLRRLGEVGGNIQCDPSVTVSALDYVMGSEGRLDVRLELSVTASVFEVIEKKVITDLTLLEEHSKEQKAAALTIYYCDAGENVWDIAVRYNTTVQAIMSENQLTEEMVPERCMLLIPSA